MFRFYLGIDWGTSKIGLAMGDNETQMALPLTMVKTLDEVLEIIKKESIDHLVIGQPVKMSGQTHDLTPEFELFLKKLKTKTKLPLDLIDERLTSQQADNLFGCKKTKANQDAIAAMLILQAYFDQKRRD